MKDRVPVNPGRVLITPENGSAAYYATMTRADNPTQEGTPLNKSSLLKDATAALFGLGTDAVPDDVLAAIKTALTQHDTEIAAGAKIATGSYTGTGTYGSSNPCSLTFDFVPKVVVIRLASNTSSVANSEIFISPAAAMSQSLYYPNMGIKLSRFQCAWAGKSLSWYKTADTGGEASLNWGGETYYYAAIG